MSRPIPEWFTIAEASNAQVMKRIAASVSSNDMSWQVRSAGMLAQWFVMDSLLLANQANRDGMHANALSLTRQCIEAIGIIELTICGHPDAEEILLKWEADDLKIGSAHVLTPV